MAECQLCKRDFNHLKFVTDHIKVCTRCVNTLNDFSEPAIHAQNRLGEKLARGMERNALRDLESPDEWVRRKARWTLENFDAAYQKALPGWLNRLLAETGNTTRDFKTVRAYRRGLLRLDGDRPWSYPSNWKDVAADIRKRDRYRCMACGTEGAMLDVHHIIYLSNFGTNQQSNLVTLCRACHEKEHDRVFDFGEQDDPEVSCPIVPTQDRRPTVELRPNAGEILTMPISPTTLNSHREIARADPDSEDSIDPYDHCGEPFEEVYFPAFGYVHRCTGCGYIPSLKIHDSPLVAQDVEEGPCEGALVLEQAAEATESLAAPVPPPVGVTVQREAQPVQRPASFYTRYEPVPRSDGRTLLRMLLEAVIAIVVVILVVFLGLQ